MKSDVKFTPVGHSKGPWIVEPIKHSDHYNLGIRVKGKHVSGYCAFIDTKWAHVEQVAEQEANAQLIASAPELLEALEACLKSAYPNKRDNPAMFEAFENAKSIVQKARGAK